MLTSRAARELLAAAALLLFLAAMPWIATASGDPYLLKLATRIVVYGLAASALDLALGVAGLIGFGHAAFLGLGAYTVGIAFQHGFEGSTLLGLTPPESALIRLPLAMLVAGTYGFLTGLVALRTRGVAFIMSTLAFGQMAYFLFLSLKPYGGQDGIALWTRSSGGPVDLEGQTAFYLLCLACLTAYLLLARRLLRAPFGRVLRAARDEERRAEALGFPTFRHRLAAYTLSAAVTGLAGALLADAIYFVGPSFLGWQTSGELIVMAVLGGLGSIVGPVIGAAAFILLEDVGPILLDRFGQGMGEHWKLVLGLILLAMALGSRQGIWGWLVGRGARA
jgi:branched-chain amino acid transport system permease protein